MRQHAAASAVLCLLGWLCTACQSRLTTPTSTPLPTAIPIPAHTWTPTSELLPTITPAPSHTLATTPTPGPLTDAEAIALVEEEAAARGVALSTLRITIEGEPRWASIRYSSSYTVNSRIFQPQTVLVALAAARVLVRVQPPMDGGIRLAVIPGGESEAGLRVTVIVGSSLEGWANGTISDQEFVGQWMVGTVTRE
jgi:hypothetical protein